MMKYFFSLIIFVSVFAKGQDTVKIYYNINESKLTQFRINQLEKAIDEKKIDKVQIIGYTDYLGTEEYNIFLSRKRADQVKNFFSKKNIPVEICKGKGITGKRLQSKKGIRENRRVDVLIFEGQSGVAEIHEKTPEKDSLTVDIEKIKVGDKLVLKNFNFIPGRHYLVAESKPELTRLIDIMLKNPSLKIELHGHICCETDHEDGWDVDAMEYKLSFNRAKYIHDQLVKFGVSSDRLSYKGFGRKTPLYPLELDDSQKAANRRVEILIIEK